MKSFVRLLCLLVCMFTLWPRTAAWSQSIHWNEVVRATPALVPAQVDCNPLHAPCYYKLSAPFPTLQRVPAQKAITESIVLDINHPTSISLGNDTLVAVSFATGAGPSDGVLLYRLNAGVPRFLAGLIGDNLTFASRNGRLMVREGVGGAGNSRVCGPYGVREAEYVMNANRLRRVAWHNEGVSKSACAVWNFYLNVNAGQYQAAYASFAPAYRAQRPYEQWLKDAQAYEYDLSSLNVTVEDQAGVQPQTALVHANLAVLPRAAATDPLKKNRFDSATRYLVTWKMVWDSKTEQWLLTWMDAQLAN